jgi:hypothetical protein
LDCDSAVLGAVIDEHGEVLALGRTRRLVSKALRRALMIRDKMCRYPGCHQMRHLDFALRRRQQLDQLAAVDSFQHPDAQTIRPDGPVNPSTCTPAC